MHCRFIGQAFKGKRSLTIRQKGDFFYYTTDSDFMHRIVKRKYRQSWNNAYEILRIEGKGSCEYLQWQVPWRCSRSADKYMFRCDRALIVPGPGKFCGFFGTDSEYVIPFACIKKIGPDIILVEIKEEKFLQKY